MQSDLQQAAAYHQYATELETQGQLGEAVGYYQRALALLPQAAVIHFNLGNLFRVLGQIPKAMQAYRAAIACDPALASAYNNLGILLEEQFELEAAEECYKMALEIEPGYILARNNLGALYQRQNLLDKAMHHFRLALESAPGSTAAHFNLGTILFLQGQLDEARRHYETVFKSNSSPADAHVGLGNIWRQQGELDKAQQAYHLALQFDPDLAQAKYNLGFILLLKGELKEGFRLFEYRWACRQNKPPLCFAAPLWQGEDLHGKSILLYGEQGFGDVIQFIRFVPLVARRGGRVSIVCPRILVTLIQGAKGVEKVIAVEEVDSYRFDVCAFLMSLPCIFGTTLETIPREMPYLDNSQFSILNSQLKTCRELVEPSQNSKFLKIGIAWASGFRDDPEFLEIHHQKSCSLEHFRPLFEIPDIQLYSLQVGERSQDLYRLERIPVIPFGEASPLTPHSSSLTPLTTILDLSPTLHDFADTAAVVVQLDLVITVDTAVAHLAGALAKPVWILLPYVPDWRWMLDRTDSPWYPTARLFRQSRPEDWAGVVNEARDALRAVLTEPALGFPRSNRQS